MDEEDIYNVIIVRTITSAVTLGLCLFLIITYFILCLQVKCGLLVQKTAKPKNSRNSFIEKSGLQKDMDKSQQKKIGLGSNYMFLLIMANFLGGIFEFCFYFYYKNLRNTHKDDIRGEINDSRECIIFGFTHNFFDILSICWTTMLSLLFYRSTDLSSEMLYKDTKYLLLGFTYGLVTCFICCVVPLWFNCYGYAETYCSFRVEKENPFTLTSFKILTLLVILGNSFYNVYCFYKTTAYYSKKLEILKNQNKKEFKLIKIFVRVFQTFPAALVIIRLIKGVNTIIVENYNDENHLLLIKVCAYANDISFNLNGAINSLACIFFFRGVFWCCCSSDDKEVEKTGNLEAGSNNNGGGYDINTQLVVGGDSDNNSINELKEKN